MTNYQEQISESGGHIDIGLSITDEAIFTIPGLQGVSIVIGGASADTVTIGVDMDGSSWAMSIAGSIRLRFPRDWLRPVIQQDGEWIDDPINHYAEISLSAGIRIQDDWSINIVGSNQFSLGSAMIANSGFVIESTLESRSFPD